ALHRESAFTQGAERIFAEAAEAGTFSGSVVIVDGPRRTAKGFGLADRRSGRRNTPETIFRIASVSKQFTASGILTLVADGRVAVTDPVSKYFPEYPRTNLVKDGVEVTLHHLLSHTSGLPDPLKMDTFVNAMYRRPFDPLEYVRTCAALPLV